jgi:light-regulated signal transduction histidine kinase (bacteriophytochrome)
MRGTYAVKFAFVFLGGHQPTIALTTVEAINRNDARKKVRAALADHDLILNYHTMNCMRLDKAHPEVKTLEQTVKALDDALAQVKAKIFAGEQPEVVADSGSLKDLFRKGVEVAKQ